MVFSLLKRKKYTEVILFLFPGKEKKKERSAVVLSIIRKQICAGVT